LHRDALLCLVFAEGLKMTAQLCWGLQYREAKRAVRENGFSRTPMKAARDTGGAATAGGGGIGCGGVLEHRERAMAGSE